MASTDYVNYSIRPNKTVERKLVFETLAALAQIYDFSICRYIGFGALWFVDFVLAHKYLSISDMVSIENDRYLASRAEFNKPYACVKVEHGDSDIVLPSLQIEERPILAWLDYDTSLDGPVLKDLSTLCHRALTGSLVIVTINAHKNSLPNKDENNRKFQGHEEQLRYFADDLIPQTLPKGTMQTSKYPAFLASLIFSHMHRQLRLAGRGDVQIVPLFNIAYKDNAPMITVGAAIADELRAQKTKKEIRTRRAIALMDAENQLSIGVPPLTLKEKTTLDQMMPCDPAPSEDAVSQLGFRLKPRQIKAYHRFYRHYPMFGEVTI